MPKNGLNAWYDAAQDRWLVESPAPLSDAMLAACRDYLYRVHHDRYRGMMPGDKKDYVKKALLALRANRIVRKVNSDGDIVLFQSTQGTGKVISLPGA